MQTASSDKRVLVHAEKGVELGREAGRQNLRKDLDNEVDETCNHQGYEKG